jgi:ornithine carbamoyltransferase
MSAPKDFLSLADWPAEELRAILTRAHELKRGYRKGETPQTLRGRTLAMYFEKPSLRTHVTFEAGMTQLGGHAILLRPEQVGIGTRESPADVARNLSRWVHGILARTYDHALVEELAAAAEIPVINGLTDLLHPCQVMGDILTIEERLGTLEGKTVCMVGDGNNLANSWLEAAGRFPFNFVLACPPGYEPDEAIVERVEREGASFMITNDPQEAVDQAHVIYGDVWTSMGQEAEAAERLRRFNGFQINTELLAAARPEHIVLHCLPAHRGEEITDEVMDGEHSAVFDQAENRLHVQRAILALLMS